jgi:hypothetical protein
MNVSNGSVPQPHCFIVSLLSAYFPLESNSTSNAYRILDEAVFVACDLPSNLTGQEILSRLLALNHERAVAQTAVTS